MPYKDLERQKEYQKQWDSIRPDKNEGRRKRVEYTRSVREKPCTDCGVQYPYYVMQFDHIGSDKTMNVVKAARSFGWEKLLTEIAKCEVVCANCHAERTWKRLQTHEKSTSLA